LLICEAKTQGLGNYSKVISAEGTARVEKMLIRPFRELYPNHSLDFLLMGSKPYLFDPVSERRLRSNLIRLNELLNENEMGMIPFYFVDTKAKMDEVAESMVNMHKAIGKKKVMLDEMFTSEQDRIWFENHDFLYMIKGRRFEKILQKSNGVYRLVYSLK